MLLILLAELHAHGVDVELDGTTLRFTESSRPLPESLQAELDTNWRTLTAYVLDLSNGVEA